MTMRKWVITAALLAAAATGSLAQGQQQGQHMPMGQGMGMMGGCPMMGNMPMGMGSMGQGMGPGMMMGMGPMMEGGLANLKAELGITDTQAAAWDGYVSAVKARGDTMQSMHATMMQAMQSGTAVARLDAHAAAMQSMMDSMKSLKPATEALYKVLGDDQKKKADMLLGMGCCMM